MADDLEEVVLPPPKKGGRKRKNLPPEDLPEELNTEKSKREEASEGESPETGEKAEPPHKPSDELLGGPSGGPLSESSGGESMPAHGGPLNAPLEPEPEKQLFTIERQSPPTVVLPNGEAVSTKGHSWQVEGEYTKDQVKELVIEHGGKGIFALTSRSSRTGRLTERLWLVKNDAGEVNVPYLLADLYPNKARELLRAGLISPEGALEPIARSMNQAFQFAPPGVEAPGQSSDDEESDLDVEDSPPEDEEVSRLEAEKESAKKKQEIERQKKQLAEEQRKLHELEEERKKEEQRTEAHKARLDAREAREAGVGEPAPAAKLEVLEDDDDRPMTKKEMREAIEKARLETENAALKAAAASRPAENGLAPLANMLIAASQAQTEAMKEISKNNSANEARNRESMMEMVKTMMASASEKTASAEKQMDMLLKVLDLREDKKKGELDFMIKLMETGANLAGSGSTQGTPWWQELLGGIGQLGSVVADKIGGGGGAPRAVPVQQVEQKPGAVQIDPNQVAGSEAVVLPGQPAAPTLEPETGGQNVEDEFKDTVAACIESIMNQRASKPSAAEWVEIAYQDLPYEVIKQIALAQDPKDLLSLVEPYITVGMKLQAAALVQSDKLLIPWLQSGFEELQAQCREKVAEMEPGVLAPEPESNNPEESKEEAGDVPA